MRRLHSIRNTKFAEHCRRVTVLKNYVVTACALIFYVRTLHIVIPRPGSVLRPMMYIVRVRIWGKSGEYGRTR